MSSAATSLERSTTSKSCSSTAPASCRRATRSVGAFLDWLDSEVYILGFSKFYEDLTGGTFSSLDIICLLAAIVPCRRLGEHSRDINDGRFAVYEEVAASAANGAALALGIAAAITGAFGMFTDAVTKQPADYSGRQRFGFICDFVASGSCAAITAYDKFKTDEFKASVALIDIVVGIFALRTLRPQYSRDPVGFSNGCSSFSRS
jgi:hypothetical protein